MGRAQTAGTMPAKSVILDELREPALLLPQRLERALASNDRVKLVFSLLQSAEQHADHPEETPQNLAAEQRAAGLDADFDEAAARSRREPDGALYLPGATRLRELLLGDVRAMLEPLALAHTAEAEELAQRAQTLERGVPEFPTDHIPPGLTDALTRIAHRPDSPADSVHRLVMDTHRALNALQESLAVESLEGARVWRIEEPDRALVRAFMLGVHQTAALKFDHPGLATTATHTGARLVIQNDIGTTDAHVLVVHVEGLTASLTYTDVHAQRIAFFKSLFTALAVHWSDAGTYRSEQLREEPEYRLSIGRFEAQDRGALERYLTFLGSRIVFLIDWNRARKQLRPFARKEDALRLLKWAADENVGHRGFLQLGGERLVNEAIEFAQPTPLRAGESLHETLGDEATNEYLQFVFRETTTGLLQGRSERFIRDEIKAELARRFRSVHASLLAIALGHAERVFDLAYAVRDGLLAYAEPGAAPLLERTARRARTWEQESDAIVSRVRALARRTSNPAVYGEILHDADEAADGLEEAAFLMTHLSRLAPPAKLMEPLQTLAELLVAGAQEGVKMFEAASHVTRGGEREDLQDFFAAVDRIIAIEHRTDTAERAVTSTLLWSEADARTLHLLARLTQSLEGAADGLALGALKLRDHLLNEVMRS